MTREEYDRLTKQQAEASAKNDYSTLIMSGDPVAIEMHKFFQDNICSHPNVRTDGGGDYCDTCGKRW